MYRPYLQKLTCQSEPLVVTIHRQSTRLGCFSEVRYYASTRLFPVAVMLYLLCTGLAGVLVKQPRLLNACLPRPCTTLILSDAVSFAAILQLVPNRYVFQTKLLKRYIRLIIYKSGVSAIIFTLQCKTWASIIDKDGIPLITISVSQATKKPVIKVSSYSHDQHSIALMHSPMAWVTWLPIPFQNAK